MKKILLVIPSLRFWGWAEWVIVSLAKKLIDRWFDVTILTFYDFPWDEYEYSGKRLSLHEWWSFGFISRFLKLITRAWEIRKYIKNNSFSTVISFMEDANFPLLLAKKLFHLNQKCIVAIRHSLDDYVGGMYERFIWILYPIADKIVVLTEYERYNLVNNFHILPEKIVIIHNAIDIDQAIEKSKQPLPYTEDKFIFIAIGRLTWIKNHKLLIKTYRKFHIMYPNTSLWILGDGTLREELEWLRSGDESIVFFWNQWNIFPFLQKAQCFVLTSISEAFPNVILQAMAMWLPIISTNTQWSREILGKNDEFGIIVENNQSNNLSKAMDYIYNDVSVRKSFASKSKKRVVDFSLDTVYSIWENLLLSK